MKHTNDYKTEMYEASYCIYTKNVKRNLICFDDKCDRIVKERVRKEFVYILNILKEKVTS